MNIFDSGIVYKYTVDPILSRVQDIATSLLPGNKEIIDIACGTGSFAFKLALKSKHVTGIDHSKSMYNLAIRAKQKISCTNVDFILSDVINLKVFSNDEFDSAILSMVLHQFSQKTGFKVLFDAIRISKEILIIDYSYPLTPPIYRYIVSLVERMAGIEHYTNFRSYIDFGGINSYIKQTDLKVIAIKKIKSDGIFAIYRCMK